MKRRVVIGLFVVAMAFSTSLSADTGEPKPLWEVGKFENPESVVRDPRDGALYVSNINGEMLDKDGNGYIAKLSADGHEIKGEWAKGFDAPKGLAISGRRLFVADIDRLVAVDLETGDVIRTYEAKDAKFLNDVAASVDGRVFVSDSMTNTIWVLDGETFVPWLSDEKLNSPNGLIVESDKLVVATIGKMPTEKDAGLPGHLVEVRLSDKSIRNIGNGSPIGFLDGVESLGDGRYLVTDFIKGTLSRVDEGGKATILVTFPKGAADFAYDPATKRVVVPLTAANVVTAYQIN